ncbi:MAG: tRNA-dihydrouridine synthase [Kiritimatiellae bacterium]|nr:tRNA-dihydrouridine synthase [Kiritimatiellia bacterium]
MAGFTDAPFRRLCFEGGAALSYSEMVSAAGLAHGSKPTEELMETLDGEGPVSLQLFGAKPDEMAIAVKAVTGFLAAAKNHLVVELNLNAGCPMSKVTRCGAGAALVKEPRLVGELLAAMRENSPLPVTLKTRLGPHPGDIKIFDLLAEAEKAGAKSIAVHARFTSQLHGGDTNLALLAEVKRRAKIEVFGNGSVKDRESAAAMAATGVDAILIGRAALGNPAIFAQLSGEKRELPDLFGRHIRYLLEFRELLAGKYAHVPSADDFVCLKARTHLFRYLSGLPGAAELRRKLHHVRTLADLKSLVDISRKI